MDAKMVIETVKAELEQKRAEYRHATDRAKAIVADYAAKPTSSTHFGHNLASAATDLSAIAGKIEEVMSILAFLESQAE